MPTDEEQENVKPERTSGSEADADDDESGFGEEEVYSSESKEEEEEEVEPEQDDETDDSGAEAQQFSKYIIARKYVHVSKLIWDDELKYG